MLYRGFPSKLHHAVPDWVQPGALFHIRIGLDRTMQQATLITSPLAESLMESAKFYDRKKRWYISRTREAHEHDESMSLVIGAWKHYQSYQHGIMWQEGYFDHRLRDDERGEQLTAKINYIR